MTRLLSGRLDRRITLLRKSVTTGDFNDEVVTWSPIATVWAEKKDISDRERLQARETTAEITTRFRIRWSQVVRYVDPEHRIEYDGRTYEIFSVKEVGRRDGLEITAMARAERNASNS